MVADVDASRKSVFRNSFMNEQKQVLSFSYVRQLADAWQFGFRLPYQKNIIADETGNSIGDVSFNINYEFLPELEFSYWKPRGFLSFYISAPTGDSIYTSSSGNPKDYTGNGTWGYSLVLNFSKILSRWDMQYGLSYGHKQQIKQTSGEYIRYKPIGSFFTAIGYSPKWNAKCRFGVGLAALFKGESYSTVYGRSRSSLVWDFTLQTSYMIKDNASIGLNYLDQSLVGPTYNTSVVRALLVNYTVGDFL